MTLLTREHLQQAATTFEKVEVDVSEWGAINAETGERERTTVFVREMSARERSKFEMAGLISKNRKVKFDDGHDVDAASTMRERLAVATCCDADGTLIFKPEDVEWLRDRPVKVLERIFEAALKINRMKKEDVEDEQETVKN